MKASKALIAGAAALIPLSFAVAADNQPHGDKDKSGMMESSFKKLDTNGDGRISQAEAAADTTVVFSSADANGDGYLDSAEWKASTRGSKHQPQSTEPVPSPGEQPATAPAPDTETPRQ